MITTYVVRLPDGQVQEALNLTAARQLVLDNPGAKCAPVVHYRPCQQHRGFEDGNCPACPGQELP